jgi:Ca2+:H+ antiporter
MSLQFWPGAVVMMLIATMTASLVTNNGRSAWFVGVLVLMVYLIFALTLYLLPPRTQGESKHASITAMTPIELTPIEHRLRYLSV